MALPCWFIPHFFVTGGEEEGMNVVVCRFASRMLRELCVEMKSFAECKEEYS